MLQVCLFALIKKGIIIVKLFLFVDGKYSVENRCVWLQIHNVQKYVIF